MVEIISTKIVGTQKSRQPNGHIYHRIAMPPDCVFLYRRNVYSDGRVEFIPQSFTDKAPV